AGLTLSTAGLISGTPTTAGPAATFTVQVTDSGSPAQTASKPLSLTINVPTLSITTPSPLPAGIAGTPYSQTLAATGGTASSSWLLPSRTFSAGLTLSTAGLLSGTPPTAGPAANFTVQVTDSGTHTASQPFSLTINPATLLITTTSLPAATVGAAYSQTLT